MIEKALTAGGVKVLGKKIYDPKATSFDAEVGDVASQNPDAVVLVTFDEGSRILKTMVQKGVGPAKKKARGLVASGVNERNVCRSAAVSSGSAAGGAGQRAQVQLDHGRVGEQFAT